MPRSDLIGLMTNQQKALFLRQIKNGSLPADWMLEGFQDLGLIDHKDKVTKDGEAVIANVYAEQS